MLIGGIGWGITLIGIGEDMMKTKFIGVSDVLKTKKAFVGEVAIIIGGFTIMALGIKLPHRP